MYMSDTHHSKKTTSQTVKHCVPQKNNMSPHRLISNQCATGESCWTTIDIDNTTLFHVQKKRGNCWERRTGEARQTAKQQPFQHLRSQHHCQPTQQPSCLPNKQYVNTYTLYQTRVECRSNNIKQQQQQTTTQVQCRNLNDGGQQRPRQTATTTLPTLEIKPPLTTNTTAVLPPQWTIRKHLHPVSNERRMPQQQHQTTTTTNNHRRTI